MASALPVIQSVVKEFLQSRNLQSSTKPSTENVVSDNSTLQAIVNQTGIDSSSNLTAILESNFPLGIAKPVDLDIAVTSNKKYWNLGVFNLLSHLRLRHNSKLPPHNHHQLLLDDHLGNTHRETKTFVRVQAHLVSRLGPDLRRDYQELWAQDLIGGRSLCPSFSRLQPRLLALRTGTPPNPPPPPNVLGSISVEESEDQEDQESDQALPEAEPAGALEPWAARKLGRREKSFLPSSPAHTWELNLKKPGG
uniref:Uncharacterized protein n=1 Tax=Magallana gigas TaxID=29159 RepID=K1R0B3_MAGGI